MWCRFFACNKVINYYRKLQFQKLFQKQWQKGQEELESWARDGLTDEQIAHNMGICRDTLIQWKKKYSDISDTLKRGKDVIDIQVENALHGKNLLISIKVQHQFKMNSRCILTS